MVPSSRGLASQPVPHSVMDVAPGGIDSGLPIDFAALNEVVGALYDGALESPPWQSAMQLLRGHLNAAHVTLMLRPPSSDNTGIMINTGPVTTQGLESYENHFFSLDPFVRLGEGQVVTAEELIGKQWLDSPIYLEYLRPLGIRHLLGADIYTRDGVECRFRVTRAENEAGFSDADKALVGFVLPHLKRSIQLHTRLDFLEGERQLFAGTVNRMLLGMVSFAEDGEILETNQEARRILAERDGLWLTDNKLCVSNAQESREMLRLIKLALTDARGNDGASVVQAISVTRPSGRAPLGILIRAVPMGQWTESKRRSAAVMFLRDAESNVPQPSQELVRRLFGLTRKEAALALLLAEGFTLDEAADKMDVRRNTARTHLRSIFCKTGVTRQTMLVRLLLNSVVTLG
ncbi:helix-turn-helix transcriptional regulator [Polycyclovorans algicola]|uniref:helix-turn-helix transcriptional regulator n=1 Tax=Polycyclovorans algicola TaxID=616992 RepID=UPI000694B07E|nr:helix-turn-helix transcriptional regulator [Polycyclovorans algicola]